ncbi:uncharacterized protein OCT59_015972 [Rhizophagus irregularis]|uniref:Uncharacterized protein n=1 Tax=Rhizophagus irregularis (strain DAOM 197198w) TaxID=1432141 RepID=A0A015JQU6_RHIIW|nr:hypothetical protein RirG_074310 [Rhizophagus irregularis DAOM 197198w]UZO23640.1 hypothetical protein OCT59_015972 [Rhizophagus irregularis]CAG8734597.1 15141_t:CDS:1 [Rhizophagus irregularis]
MKGTLKKNTPNKFEALFGEVSGSMTSLGVFLHLVKKDILDKVKLGIMMRDSLNSALKGCKGQAKLSQTKNSMKELYCSNMRKKYRKTTREYSPVLNINSQ